MLVYLLKELGDVIRPFFLYLFHVYLYWCVCMPVCERVYIYVGTNVHVDMHVEAQSLAQLLSILFIKAGSLS